MTYNVCGTCGACDGRAGMLTRLHNSEVSECNNCSDTRQSGNIVIHAELKRTQEELHKTFAILTKPQDI